ncbi:hypothetical protein TNCV_1171761 [Trichonephila clavipes]|uniref:Uncharacterized protein n=1 Tax=Trichonephila clavipes TaxID=2585209 RepID=A0A8X6S763_TRICX|nr:hypothetical protein TNCV_1171761 [Trichonephila clavipes]
MNADEQLSPFVQYFVSIHQFLAMTPQGEISNGVRSGDCDGHRTRSLRLIERSEYGMFGSYSTTRMGIDSTTRMVRKYKDSTPQVSPLLLYSILPMQILTSSFHHFTETVQRFDEIAYFHQRDDLEETLF